MKWWVPYATGGTRLAESLKISHGVAGVKDKSLKGSVTRALTQDLGDQMLSPLTLGLILYGHSLTFALPIPQGLRLKMFCQVHGKLLKITVKSHITITITRAHTSVFPFRERAFLSY